MRKVQIANFKKQLKETMGEKYFSLSLFIQIIIVFLR